MKCKICDNAIDNNEYKVKEMMFGFRDEFLYFQCSNCGFLQIAEIPADMSKYYPSNYYSFLLPSEQSLKNHFKRVFKNIRNRYALFNKGVIGKLFYYFFPDEETFRLLSQIHLKESSMVLDVGCGMGSFLYQLKEIGFKNILGIDPYIKEDTEYKNGLKILKKTINELEGKWDVIIFHHSFEHIPNQIETLLSVSRLLSDDGVCLISVPTVSSFAWEHYRENWVQLDAPRHFFLHSKKSITLSAEKGNLTLEKVVYDSTDFQFRGSELYLRDIPLTDSLHNSIFSEKEIAEFKRKSNELNLNDLGDSCTYFLRKNR